MNINTLMLSAPLLFQGAAMTCALWLTASIISLLAGTIAGAVRCLRMRIAYISEFFDLITFVLRGVPFYIQLLIAYFVLPDLLQINVPTFVIASLALGLCSAAYVSQMIRGGLNAIADGQWEAAQALGYSQLATLRFIIIPQVIRAISPSLIGELDQLLKSTSILSTIGVLELTRAGMNIIAREMNPISMYAAIAIIYLAMSTCLNIVGYWLEQRLKIEGR